MASPNFISWSEFNPESLCIVKTEKVDRSIDDKQYSDWKLLIDYIYPNGKKGPLLVEYPRLTSLTGVKGEEKATSKGKPYTSYSISGRVTTTTDEGREFVNKFHEPFKNRMRELALEYYTTIYNKKDKVETREVLIEQRVRAPFFEPTDKEKNIIEDADYLLAKQRLANFDRFKTVFTDPALNILTGKNGAPLDWNRLSMMSMEYQPLVSFREFTVPGNNLNFTCTALARSIIIYEMSPAAASTKSIQPARSISNEQANALRNQLEFMNDREVPKVTSIIDEFRNSDDDDEVVLTQPPPKKLLMSSKSSKVTTESDDEEQEDTKSVEEKPSVVPKKPTFQIPRGLRKTN
jgi:hypothetical protein